jgi:hypothetical protein
VLSLLAVFRFKSPGKAREHESVLDHICVSKELVATISVLNNTTTDHYLLLTSVRIDMASPSSRPIDQMNFKKVTQSA